MNHLKSILICFLCSFLLLEKMQGQVSSELQINGISLESPPRPVSDTYFKALADIHCNFIGIVPYGYSRQGESQVHYNSQRQWWGERPEGVRVLANMAKANGMAVMIKPQVWMSSHWIGDYTLDNEPLWLRWEAEYQKFILEFAVLAEEVDAEILCIGTEYKIAATHRPQFWRKLITEVRKVYHGKLTYSANWDEYGEISFWEDLDYIGISGYFPLSETKVPTLLELSAAWSPVKALLRELSLISGIPILFTEFGYRSVEKAAGKHWTLDDEPLNTEAQRIAFQAFFDNLWQEPWVTGGFVWKWELRPEAGGPSDRKYTPQSKPAQEVIANAFAQ